MEFKEKNHLFEASCLSNVGHFFSRLLFSSLSANNGSSDVHFFSDLSGGQALMMATGPTDILRNDR